MKFYRYNGMMEGFDLNDEKEIIPFEQIYESVKETPGGYWIIPDSSDGWSVLEKKRWVSKYSKKRWAYPTKEQALTSFKRRKIRQIEILSDKLEQAREDLRLAGLISLQKEEAV